MNIEKELKKNGITVIDKLDTLSINTLAKNIAQKLCRAFPNQRFIAQKLFIAISRIPMYYAEMPEGLSEANYFYKNSSIYFSAGLSLDEIEKFAIHEVIHYLQEVKDKRGNLKKLGLCVFTSSKEYGMALNEAAVQLATSKALRHNYEMVKYYDIAFSTTSPTYYPILCNLVAQLVYITNENDFYDSMFSATTQFQQNIIQACGEKVFFYVQDMLDRILYAEEKIINLNNKLLNISCTDSQAAKYGKKISTYKNTLKKLYFETQNIIFTSYFDNEIKKLVTTADIDEYRYKLYNFKNYLGSTDGYTFFNDYYVQQMEALDIKYDSIINNVSLVPVNTSKWQNILHSLKNVFSLKGEKRYNVN